MPVGSGSRTPRHVCAGPHRRRRDSGCRQASPNHVEATGHRRRERRRGRRCHPGRERTLLQQRRLLGSGAARGCSVWSRHRDGRQLDRVERLSTINSRQKKRHNRAWSERERIFDRFVRLDKARTDAGGAGLGLSIARWIAESHYGTVTLEETGASGSTFVVRLPLTPAAEKRTPTARRAWTAYASRVEASNPAVASAAT